MSSTVRSAHLVIRGIAVPVRLGCLPGEQDEPQRVEFEVTIRFASPPAGVETDDLADTVDYGTVVDRIKEVVADRRFDLVEHLAGRVFENLRALVPPEHTLEIAVRKVTPPVPEITGGAVFTLVG
ncbi:MAG: dihydroneopterin aldolase [Gemmatimonadota bacterium]|nr:dihydroneopterin aldolase [Gemmatimonadota bacterium]